MSQWLLVKSISLSLNLNNFKCLRAPIWLKYKRHMTTCACTVWRLTAAACCFACKLVCAVTTGRKEKSESVITLYELQAVIVVTSAVYIACLWLYLQQLWSANNHLWSVLSNKPPTTRGLHAEGKTQLVPRASLQRSASHRWTAGTVQVTARMKRCSTQRASQEQQDLFYSLG